jgi:queuosine precursor transporter
MNESLFCIHILTVLIFLGIAVRLGQHALMVFVALSGLFANLFVLKQTVLFGLHVTCSDVFTVGGILGLNLLQELFGRAAAQKAVRISLFALLLFVAMSQIHLLYTPSPFDQMQGAYRSILSNAPRIVGASIGVYYLVQCFDVLFFGFLKGLIPNLAWRLALSLTVSQAIDTVLFSFFGLYGLVASMLDIILISFAVKCTIIACSSPVAAFFKRFNPREAE